MTDITQVPTIEDIYAAKAAMDDIQSFTYDAADSFIDANEITRDTIAGRIKKMGYEVPLTYTGGIVFAVDDNVKTVEESGVVYAAKPSVLPFTTDGTFANDAAKFFAIQFPEVETVKPYTTVPSMQASVADLSIGDTVICAERTIGNGGGATWDVVDATTVVENELDIVTGDATRSFMLRGKTIFTDQWGLSASNTAAQNTVILQAIADEIGTNKRQVILTPGASNSFDFNGPITFTSPSFDWTFYVEGVGFNNIELVNKSTSGEHGFVLTGASGTESVWSKFKGFLITGNASSGDGFHCEFSGRVEFEEVEASDNGGSGFHYENSWSPSFKRCRGDRNGDYGVYCLGGPNNNTNGAYFEGGAYSSNTLDGIYIEAATHDDTLSGEIINVGLSNNNRNGIWVKTPGLSIFGCFPEFNKGAQIKIGDSADARTIVGVSVDGCHIDARNVSGADYDGIVIEEARGISVDACNFKNVVSCIDIDGASTGVTIGTKTLNRRTTGSTTNIADVNGTLITDASQALHIRSEIVQVGIGSINKYQVESGTTGYRLDIEGNGAVATNPLTRILKDGVVLAGMRNDGRLILDGAIANSGTPAAVQNKIEIYDAAGVSLGWIPIYANF
ncbi:MAG: right-handed parallel beta-helix repeat-containing protein [Colwellia sp.]|nr:right-handed parallel beta-helix repeat-containing protein [Colwellia sp.]